MGETRVSRWIFVIVIATCGMVFWLPALVRGNTAPHLERPTASPQSGWTLPDEDPPAIPKEPLSTGLAGLLCALAMGTTSLVVYILCRPTSKRGGADSIIAVVRPTH